MKTGEISQIGHRGELLAELFLQDLGPDILSRPTEDIGFDFLVGFRNAAGGLNMFGIEVKATERTPADSFPLNRATYRRLAESNLPACLLVADVKHNRLFYSWIDQGTPLHRQGSSQVSVPVTEVDGAARAAIRRRMLAEAA